MEKKTDKKWYTEEDVELAKVALGELPDLSKKRLTKSSVLEQLKPQIISLSDSKGYSAEDIKSALDSVGITVGLKSIRDIISSKKKPARSTRRSTKSNATGNNSIETTSSGVSEVADGEN